VIFQKVRYAASRCKRNIEMTPFSKIEVFAADPVMLADLSAAQSREI
jgi:hypothetical protein